MTNREEPAVTETSTQQPALTCGCGIAHDGAPGSSQDCSAGCMVPEPTEGEVGEEHAKLLKAQADLANANHLMAELVAAVTDHYVGPEPGVSEDVSRRRLGWPHQNCERWLYGQDVPVPDWQWRKAQQIRAMNPMGEVHLTALFEDGVQTGIRVDRADDRVLVSAGVLSDAERAEGVLTIRAVNGTWRYRVVANISHPSEDVILPSDVLIAELEHAEPAS